MAKVSVTFAIVFIALAVFGQLPGVYPFFVLSLLVLLLLSPRAPAKISGSNPLFRMGLMIILGCSATLLPLPGFLAGTHRATAFRNADALRNRLDTIASVSSPEYSPDSRSRHDTATQDPSLTNTRKPRQFLPDAPGHTMAYLTLNRAGTIRTVFLVAGFFVCFWFCATSTKETRRKLLVFLIVLGTICSLTGMISRFFVPQGKTILWMFPVTHGKPIGPFVNRNHFGFLCALLVPQCLLFTTCKNTTGVHSMPAGLFFNRLFFLFCALILTGGVVVSLSRSGFLVMVTGIVAVVVYSAIKRLPQAFSLAFIILFIGVGLVFLPFKAFQERIGTLKNPLDTHSAQTRLQVWKDGLAIWKKYPLLGAGADAFRVVYPAHKTSDSRKGAVHAENEYIQVLADNGLVGFALLSAAGFLFCYRVLKGPWEREYMPSEAIFFTGVAGAALCACAVEACFEFALRIPLNALVVACLLGCAYPMAEKKTSKAGDPEEVPGVQQPKRFRQWGCPGLIFFAALTIFYSRTAWKMDHYEWLEGQAVEMQLKAVSWAPTYWFPWYEAGRRLLEHSLPNNGGRTLHQKRLAEVGRECMQVAASLNALDYRMWMAVAQVAYQQGDFDTADRAAKRVIELRPYRKKDVQQFLKDR